MDVTFSMGGNQVKMHLSFTSFLTRMEKMSYRGNTTVSTTMAKYSIEIARYEIALLPTVAASMVFSP